MRRCHFLLAIVVGIVPSLAAAQMIVTTTTAPDGAIQVPMPGRQYKTGTGVIRGRVLAAETGNPIRRAQVRIMGPEILAKASLTDVEGRFEFRDLPAGRFTLNATKSGYVMVQYGQTRPYESGRPIELADKQVLENADIAMPRGSVLAGRIVDEFGEPIPDVTVTALRQSWSNGRRRLTPAGGRMGQTNDLGQFRIYGLPPGEYYVSASLRNSSLDVMPVELMAARGGPTTGPTASSPASGYAPTYFPGTPTVGDAQKITLIAGQENSSVDFALVSVRLAKVGGVVLSSDGKPMAGAMVNLIPASPTEAFSMISRSAARTTPDGTFTISGVAPGEYVLQASAVQVMTQSEGGNTMVFRMNTGGGSDQEFGSLPLSIGGDDLSNLVVMTAKGATALGRVTFEDGAKPSALNSIRISAQPVEFETPMMFAGAGSAMVKPDGAFELKGLAGPRLIRALNLPPGWTLESVRLNGADVTDSGLEFRSGQTVEGLEVVLTNRATNVTGAVVSSDGTPVKDYTIVIFADDEDLWRLPLSRWVTGRRPDQDGRFKVENLPPGTYHAIAVEYIPQGEWADPDVLARLKGKGHKFTLAKGATEALALTLTPSY